MWHGLLQAVERRWRRDSDARNSQLKLLGGAGVVLGAVLLIARRLAGKSQPAPVHIALSAALQLLRQRKVQELLYSEGGLLTLQMKNSQAGSRFLSQLVPGSEAKVFDVADEADAKPMLLKVVEDAEGDRLLLLVRLL
ncbi:ftsH [Symbiodinium sp. CCMP2456]|nr:ftsH [Symbiodinium sp. CCMP2456]